MRSGTAHSTASTQTSSSSSRPLQTTNVSSDDSSPDDSQISDTISSMPLPPVAPNLDLKYYLLLIILLALKNNQPKNLL